MNKSILPTESIDGLELMKSNGDIINYQYFDGNLWITFPCQVSRLHEARWRLKESGVKVLVVTSPFKTTGNLLKMKVLDKVTSKTNKGKTVWGFRISI